MTVLQPARDVASAATLRGDWALAGAIWRRVAELARREQSSALYQAACVAALSGDPDAAFALLDESTQAYGVHTEHLEKDEDLRSLRTDPRWPAAFGRVRARSESREVRDPALRRELLSMRDRDQAVRGAWAQNTDEATDAAIVAEGEAADRAHSARMHEIVAAHGWPTHSLVGIDGAHAAWLLVQHADLDVELQRKCLPLLARAVELAEAMPSSYAYLFDRLAVNEKRPQRYGTQFESRAHARPIEDEDHVDERRLSVGLSTMAEYRRLMASAPRD